MLNISGKKMLKAILKKFKNNNVTRNFHTMKERKDFFPLYYSYNLITLFLWVIIYRKKCKFCSEKIFSFVLYKADNVETQQLYYWTDEGHLIPN